MAASLRGRMSNSFLRNASHSNSYISPAHFLFSRGFSSKLFVKGISFATTEKSLTEAFSPFGKVVHVHISRNATTNKSKGFGHVTFEREEEAQNALTNMNGKMVDQRVIFVDKEGRYTRGVYSAGREKLRCAL